MMNRELKEIQQLLEETGVPFPESLNLKTIDGVKWLIKVNKSQAEIIQKFEQMTGKMLVHNKVNKIIEIDLDQLEN